MARIHWVPLSVLMHLNLRTLSFTQTMHVPWVISIPSKRDSHDLMECAVRGKGNTRDVLTACLQFPLILSLKQEPWDDCSWSERTTSLCWGAFLQATRKMDSEVIPSLCERDHLDSLTGWCLLWPNRRKAYVVGNSGCPIPNQCQVVHQNSMMIMTSENKFLKIQVSPNGHFSPLLTSTYMACVSDFQGHCLRTLQASYIPSLNGHLPDINLGTAVLLWKILTEFLRVGKEGIVTYENANTSEELKQHYCYGCNITSHF